MNKISKHYDFNMIKESIDVANSLIKEDIVDIKNNGTLYNR